MGLYFAAERMKDSSEKMLCEERVRLDMTKWYKCLCTLMTMVIVLDLCLITTI